MMRGWILIVAAALALGSRTLDAQTRMPPIPAEKLTDAQKKWIAANGSAPTGGPWLPLLRSPELLKEVMDIWKFGQGMRARSPKDNQLTEMAMLIASREWSAQYEWNAHSGTA